MKKMSIFHLKEVNHHQAEDLAACGLFHNWGID